MANKKITDVDVVSTINDADYLFVNQNSAIRQIKKSNIIKDIPVDTTLSVAGQAADAKATGDAINLVNARVDNLTSLPEGSTTGDAELADIRVGADGKTYPNAGEAVRGQISELKGDISNLQDLGLIIKNGVVYDRWEEK